MASGIVKKKYPDLIGKPPKKQRKGMDVWPSIHCQKRNRVCQTRSGGCSFRFKKGDRSWVCKNCGQDRRCFSKKLKGKKTCRMHGSAKGAGRAPKSMKYMPPQVILDKYNKVMEDPELLTMSHEIGLLTSYTQQIFELLDEQNVVMASQVIRKAIATIDDGAFELDMLKIRKGVQEFYKALDPITIQVMSWMEIKDNWKHQLAMTEFQNKWLLQKDEMMPRKHVLEVLIWINRISLKYIRDPSDRKAYGREVISLLPKKKI